LLTVDTSQGQWRYRLLEVARAYALERLAESDETNDVARRAAEHYVSVFRPCFDDWTRLSDEAFDARYMPDLDNLRLALDWAFGAEGDAQIGVVLTGLSGPLWVGPLMISESEQRLARAFASVEPKTLPSSLATLHLAAGSFYYSRLNQQSITSLRVAATLLRETGDAIAAGYASLLLGNSLAAIGDHDAETMLAEAKAMLVNCARPRLLALLPKTFAMYYYMRGMRAETVRENLSALALARAGGYEILALTIEENLADSLWLTGDLPEALAAARNVVEQCKRVKVSHKITWGWIYGNLLGILTEMGELDEAAIVGRLAMPYLHESNSVRMSMDHFALRLAKTGLLREAALALGWTSFQYLSAGYIRQPNELRSMNSTSKILSEHLPPDEITRLYADGTQLSEREVCNIAVT
jgi:tetratricopeptide (TPR) repeat protein